MSEAWHVYVVRTGDGALYTGIATDVERRVAEHRGLHGKGAKYLRGRGPLEIVFHRPIGQQALARRVEHRVKRLRKPDKERLVKTNPDTPHLLRWLAIEP